MIGGMKGDCNEQASPFSQTLCNFYVDLFSEYLAQDGLTVERFCGLLVGIEVPMKAALDQE